MKQYSLGENHEKNPNYIGVPKGAKGADTPTRFFKKKFIIEKDMMWIDNEILEVRTNVIDQFITLYYYALNLYFILIFMVF